MNAVGHRLTNNYNYTRSRGLSLSKPDVAFDKLRLHLYSYKQFISPGSQLIYRLHHRFADVARPWRFRLGGKRYL